MGFQFCDLPLFAVQRSAPGHWLLRAPSEDPCAPTGIVVDSIEIVSEREYSSAAMYYRRGKLVQPVEARPGRPRAVIGDVSWRTELLEYAALLDRLQPYDLEVFCLQRLTLARGLRRLARRYA
jgi:hypothetical protein